MFYLNTDYTPIPQYNGMKRTYKFNTNIHIILIYNMPELFDNLHFMAFS